jgi:hypothetical protein
MEEAESQAGKWQRLLESGLRKRAEFCMGLIFEDQ